MFYKQNLRTMNKYHIILCLLLLPIFTFALSQDLKIPNNPYDKADEYTKTKNAFNRERWFYEQRMYPYSTLPSDAYTKAYAQKIELRQKNGFFMSPSYSWICLGPTPGTYPGYGNISSRITSITLSPFDPNTIFIGGAFGGIWKSSDAGNNWTPLTDFEVSLSTGSIVIDPTNPNIIYYGTGEATYSGSSYYGRGLLKSTNGGVTWTNYTNGLPSLTYFSRLVIRPNHPSELLAALGNNGVYRSTNAGVDWFPIRSGRCDDVLFSLTGDTAWIIGNAQSMRISTNGGTNFDVVIGSGIATFGTRVHFGFCKTSPNVFYVSVYDGTTNIRVFKSTDKGLNFVETASGQINNGSQAWYDFYLHVSPFNPNIAFVGTIDIWRTTDGGVSFQNVTNSYSGGNVHPDQHNMTFHPTDPNIVWAVNDGGIWYSSNNGTTWTNKNTNLTLTQFYRIAADPSNALHLLGGTQDNGTQRTLGTLNWNGAFGGDGGDVCFHNQNPLYILGETQNNGVRRSVNGGNSWSAATNGLSGTGAWVGPLISHPDSAGIFYTARQQVFKTTNYAANWFPISTGTSGTIREMAISKSKPEVIYATSGSVVYKSTDRGYTFTQVSLGMPNRTITSINVHPDSDKVAIVTFSGFGAGKIYKTTNGGQTWNNISGDLPDSPCNDGLIYYPNFSTTTLFVAMDIGVFVSTNNGTNWTELANGLPNTVAIHLDYHKATGKLRVATHGRGIWELNGYFTGIVNYTSSTPENYKLYQNYPNPFNPFTRITFELKTKTFVKLTVFDLLGRTIKTLVNETLAPGSFDVLFDASDLPSGTYFYKLSTLEYTETKRMMLIK